MFAFGTRFNSEWDESQRKPSGPLRKLLQERLGKANPLGKERYGRRKEAAK